MDSLSGILVYKDRYEILQASKTFCSNRHLFSLHNFRSWMFRHLFQDPAKKKLIELWGKCDIKRNGNGRIAACLK